MFCGCVYKRIFIGGAGHETGDHDAGGGRVFQCVFRLIHMDAQRSGLGVPASWVCHPVPGAEAVPDAVEAAVASAAADSWRDVGRTGLPADHRLGPAGGADPLRLRPEPCWRCGFGLYSVLAEQTNREMISLERFLRESLLLHEKRAAGKRPVEGK